MTTDELKAYQKSEPFKPFRIVLDDGKSYDIPHPNFLWVLNQTVYVGTHGDVKRGFCDRSDRIALKSIKEAAAIMTASPTDRTAWN